MTKLKSEGKCVYCDKTFAKAGITRHLTTHLEKLQTEKPGKGKAFHLRVGADVFFLNLLVDGSKTLRDLDQFLRAIWLECCGHMSSFQMKGVEYDFDWDAVGAEMGEKKSTKMEKIFKKGVSLEYEYDFGSTTELDISVIDEYKLDVKEGILLLSRNEPLQIMCHLCEKKPATEICSVHIGDEAWAFCDACGKKHAKKCEDFEDYAALPIVNSPRMGTCAYEGGNIDLERDGAWKG